MKWFEVVTGCDGYYTPNRFRTEQEAENYADRIEEEDGEYCDVYQSEEEDGYRGMNKIGQFFTDPRAAIDEAMKNNP